MARSDGMISEYPPATRITDSQLYDYDRDILFLDFTYYAYLRQRPLMQLHAWLRETGPSVQGEIIIWWVRLISTSAVYPV